MRKRSFFGTVLAAVCLAGAVGAQKAPLEIVRSVVVTVDASGRLAPVAPGGRPAPGAKRYWADTPTHSIRRSNLDGSGVEEVVSGLAGPYGLSFDPATGTLLWTSSGGERVETFTPGGGVAPALETEFEEPYALVRDIEGGHIAYAVVDGQVVRITQLGMSDSEQVEVLVPGDSTADPPHGLSLDPAHGVLYVGNYDGMMSRKVRLSDGQVETLVFVDEPFSAGGGGWEVAQ